nr:uncharacterized mitochondrial protein AtMg00810-like [Tanacetum cinerariifolium]
MFGQDKDADGNMMLIPVSVVGSTYVNLGGSICVNAATLLNADLPTDPLMPDLEDTADLQDTGIFGGTYDDEVEGKVADFNNLKLSTVVSHIPITRIYKDHPKEQIIWDPLSAPQTRRVTKTFKEHDMDTGIFSGAYDDEVEGVVADLTTWNSLKLVHCVPDGCEECLSVWHNRRGGTASTPIETNKALLKDEEVKDVDVHSYRSMIGSLMYLKASRPDIMFAVCACARFQVTPKVSHLYIVKRIFRYLKGQPKLGLWYPKDSPFGLEAF